MLTPSKLGNGYYETYALTQGSFIRDIFEDKYVTPFATYSRKDLLDLIRKLTEELPHEVKPLPSREINNKSVASTITSFSPNPVSAGTKTVLTITGSNFGSWDGGTNCTVFFRNPDDGGASLIACPNEEIISWSATEIRLNVPDGAGTGIFRVRNSSGTTGNAPSSLTVDYNHTNIFNTQYRLTKLRNKNAAGGYTFVMSTSTSNSGVNFSTSAGAAPFNRALKTWRCNTGFNIDSVTGTTTSQTVDANADPDIVMFDNSTNPLPSGVLGTCYSGYGSCDGVDWYINGIDVVFRRDGTGGITWNFGPGSTTGSSYDFESVAVHELGHGHQLGHIIASGRVMHYAIANATDIRTLDATSDIAGGNFVMNSSGPMNTCSGGVTGMTKDACMLPIKLISFKVEKQDNSTLLRWSAVENYEFSHYEVETSQNGKDFTQLTIVESSQESEKYNHQYIHQNPSFGKNFYRIKMVDKDGKYELSNLVVIKIDNFGDFVNVYPNPFTDNLNIEIKEEGLAWVEIADLSGKVVYSQMGNQNFNINTSELNNGIYIIKIRTENNTFADKFIKSAK